jgi:hypothetical protein
MGEDFQYQPFCTNPTGISRLLLLWPTLTYISLDFYFVLRSNFLVSM